METTIHNKTKQKSKLKAWGGLLLGFFLIWSFAFVIGPWVQQKIPIMNEIFTLIEEQEINANAYFYTEIEASYDGETYLRNSLEFSHPDKIGFTLPFISGIVLCLVILYIGFRYMPME